jgi:hypothetical protein
VIVVDENWNNTNEALYVVGRFTCGALRSAALTVSAEFRYGVKDIKTKRESNGHGIYITNEESV